VVSADSSVSGGDVVSEGAVVSEGDVVSRADVVSAALSPSDMFLLSTINYIEKVTDVAFST